MNEARVIVEGYAVVDYGDNKRAFAASSRRRDELEEAGYEVKHDVSRSESGGLYTIHAVLWHGPTRVRRETSMTSEDLGGECVHPLAALFTTETSRGLVVRCADCGRKGKPTRSIAAAVQSMKEAKA